MLKRFVVLGIALGIICLASGGYAYAGDADEQLKSSIDKIIALMKDPAMKAPQMKAERRSKIFKAVEERFDFLEMAKRSAGEYWRTLSDAERKELGSRFAQLIENAYITRIERYTDEKIKFSHGKPKGEKYYSVHTDIISAGSSIPVEYSLYNSKGQWLVYDVNIEGISLVENYRSQFREVLRKYGFSGLMSKLDEKLKGFDED